MLSLDDIPGEWVREAKCDIYTAEEFFRGTTNPAGSEPSADYAKSLCSTCPVATECLAWVMADDKKRMARKEATNDGVWGGMTKKERATVLRGKRAS